MKNNKTNSDKMSETTDNKRQWHPNFVKYTEFIVNHKNYNGLYFEKNGLI